MNKRIFSIAVFFSVMIGLIAHADAFAGAERIKQRMIDRLPIIKALKKDGIVGENNKGYLAFIGDSRSKEDVVAAENADRKTVYQAIAEQQGTTIEKVGARRALQIAETAQPGEWLQRPTGEWYQKQ